MTLDVALKEQFLTYSDYAEMWDTLQNWVEIVDSEISDIKDCIEHCNSVDEVKELYPEIVELYNYLHKYLNENSNN